MSPPNNASGLRDNYTSGTVGNFLKEKIQDGSRLSVVSAYFTIYAYDALRERLDRIEHLDFLFGEPSYVNRLDPSKTERKSFVIDVEGLQLANRLTQKRVAKDCADWIERRVDIKTIKQSNLLHGKMYHVANGGVEEAILGSSNFTVRGLGLGAAGNNIELNLVVDSSRDRQELKQWFAEVWNDDRLVKDVKQDVLNYGRVRATTFGALVDTANRRLLKLRDALADRYGGQSTDGLLDRVFAQAEQVNLELGVWPGCCSNRAGTVSATRKAQSAADLRAPQVAAQIRHTMDKQVSDLHR